MRFLVLLLVCLVAVVAYIQRMALTVPTRSIQEDLGISERGMGLIMACWYWGYALFQVPAGWAADRLGAKRTLVLFLGAWSALTGLAGWSEGFLGLLVLWSLMGLAQTGLVPGAAKAIGVWFPPTGRAFASGALGASMALGGAVAPAVAAWLLLHLSWREMLAADVVPGLALAGIIALVVADRRDDPKNRQSFRETLRRMVRSATMLLLCAQQFFRAAAMALFFTWFPRYLQETQGVTPTESGRLAFWPGLTAMVGGLLGGLASDALLARTGQRRLSRQGVAVVGMAACSLLALAAYFASGLANVLTLISLAAFFGTFGGVSGYSVCIDFGGRRVGTVISVMNTFGNVGAGLFPIAVGWYVAATSDWQALILIFAVIFAIDCLCWLFLNPQGTLFDDAPRSTPLPP